ncbi:MAG: MTH895/ArsE family thioredoxin-like protein [Candidatus Shapirobacteria bacterium]|nr:MTH895/ArsE family thioredoxin-like protein [Candidatus Shapirobacteria bacterium]
MKIQVLGSGCPTCKNLFEITKTAVTELGIDTEVEYSTDISKIIEMGIMQSPVLAIDGKPAMVGSGNLEKVKEIIKKNQGCCDNKSSCDTNCKPDESEEKTCSCGGNC